MDFKIKNRKNEYIKPMQKQEKALGFLYKNMFGRVLLKGLTRPVVSKIGAFYMNSVISKGMIKKFVKKNGINMSEYEPCEYKSYNDFFTRRVKAEKRPVDLDKNAFISPCDSKLMVFDITKDSEFFIKNSVYRISDLLDDLEKAKEFMGGKCLIFRLTVDDYHRYCFVDNGKKISEKYIKGELHTVNPIALKNYNIYKRNSRFCTFLNTENFGEIAQIEVGALMVGRIENHLCTTFKKGQEKGFFEFGGSTIVLLVKKDIITLDKDITENSSENIETVVKYGEKIGGKL